MKEYEPMRDDDAIYGWVCGYCCWPIAYGQKYCDECGHKVRWKDEGQDTASSASEPADACEGHDGGATDPGMV